MKTFLFSIFREAEKEAKAVSQLSFTLNFKIRSIFFINIHIHNKFIMALRINWDF